MIARSLAAFTVAFALTFAMPASAFALSDDGDAHTAPVSEAWNKTGELSLGDIKLIDGMTLSPDEKTLYIGSYYLRDTVYVFDIEKGKVVKEITVGKNIHSMTFTPDGTRLYVANDGVDGVGTPNGGEVQGAITVIDATTNEIVSTIPTDLNPNGIAFNGRGSTAYISTSYSADLYEGDKSLSGEVLVLDVASSEVKSVIPVGQGASGLALTGDGKQLWVANTTAGTVSVVDLLNNTVVREMPAGVNPVAVMFSPDRSKAYVRNYSPGSLTVFDTEEYKPRSTIGFNKAWLSDMAISPDSAKLYTIDSAHPTTLSVFDSEWNTQMNNDGTKKLSGIELTAASEIELSKDGETMYALNREARKVFVLERKESAVPAWLANTDPVVFVIIGIGVVAMLAYIFKKKLRGLALRLRSPFKPKAQVAGTSPNLPKI